MSDDQVDNPNPPEAPSTTNVSGGVNVDAERDANIGGDVVGRDKIVQTIINATPRFTPGPGIAPRPPALIIGRDDDLYQLKARLSKTGKAAPQVFIAIRGWPGIGKTTLAAMLAHDSAVAKSFPDGVLWASLGPKPNLFSELAAWGRALGDDTFPRARSLDESSAKLAALMRDERRLLIIDDVWEAEHAVPFSVGGRSCATLITTRDNKVAQALAPTANDIYRLSVLTDDKALELLHVLAPSVIRDYPAESRELVLELRRVAPSTASRRSSAQCRSELWIWSE